MVVPGVIGKLRGCAIAGDFGELLISTKEFNSIETAGGEEVNGEAGRGCANKFRRSAGGLPLSPVLVGMC